MQADQILVGLNRTRRAVNRRQRALLGREGRYPVAGDRLVCLKNDHRRGLLNGAVLRAATDAEGEPPDVTLTVEDPDEEGFTRTVTAPTEHFDRYEDPRAADPRPYDERRDLAELDYAYALTVHKAQGSQWPSVLVLRDGWRDDPRWLYTAVTRAQERVHVVEL